MNSHPISDPQSRPAGTVALAIVMTRETDAITREKILVARNQSEECKSAKECGVAESVRRPDREGGREHPEAGKPNSPKPEKSMRQEPTAPTRPSCRSPASHGRFVVQTRTDSLAEHSPDSSHRCGAAHYLCPERENYICLLDLSLEQTTTYTEKDEPREKKIDKETVRKPGEATPPFCRRPACHLRSASLTEPDASATRSKPGQHGPSSLPHKVSPHLLGRRWLPSCCVRP